MPIEITLLLLLAATMHAVWNGMVKGGKDAVVMAAWVYCGSSALLAPLVNSYKRLVPGYEAPTYLTWGRTNRSALIRVPKVSPGRSIEATRVEVRCPDPTANTYLAFAAMLEPGIISITFAVAVIYIPTYFRLVRGQTLTIKEELYVEAARAIGAPGITILWKYIFPNVIATTAVVFTMNVGDAIMIEAALTYLGLGLPPSVIDWGMDLAMGKKFLPSGQWWLITFPGAMISLLAVGFTMLGEGLAEILNPRLLER